MRFIDVQAAYDLWAPTYDHLDNPMVAMTVAAMEAWLPEPGSRQRVLEIGCGTGRNARFFVGRGFEYVGIDVSDGMLAEAKRKTRDPRAQFVRADAAGQLDLGLFDGVFVSLVLEHAEDVRPLLETAARAARSGAWLRILEIHPTLRARGTRAHFVHEGEEIHPPSHPHDVDELRSAMAPAFEIVTATDWYGGRRLGPKLARYAGTPVLLDVQARRTDAATSPTP